MGLDMYLTAKIYNWSFNGESVTFDKVKKLFPNTKHMGRVKEISFEAMYWRKANQIHQWFVKNVQGDNDDCQEYEVSFDDLKKLVDTCKKVLENKELASELLPTQSGFFFGSVDYDEYYFSYLQYTIDGLQEIIDDEEKLKNIEFVYRSSW